MGLLAAVERYVGLDHAARARQFEGTVSYWIDRLAGVPGITATREFPNEAGQPTPRLRISLDRQAGSPAATDLAARLLAGNPAIAVAQDGEAAVLLTPDTLDGDAPEIVIDQVIFQLRNRLLLPAP